MVRRPQLTARLVVRLYWRKRDAKKIAGRSGQFPKARHRDRDRSPPRRERLGPAGVVIETNAHKRVQAAAEDEQFLGWQRRLITYDVVGKNQQSSRALPQQLLPAGEAFKLVGCGPVAPVLLFGRGKLTALHIDEPRSRTLRWRD